MLRWLIKILFGLALVLGVWFIFASPPSVPGSGLYVYIRSIPAPAGPAFASGESHLLAIAGNMAQVLILDTETGTLAASIGEKAAPGKDDAHFADARGIAIDRRNRHVIVGDDGNSRVQVFDAKLALVHTIGQTGVKGSDDAHFKGCGPVAADTVHDRIFVGDTRNDRVQIFDAAGFSHQGTIAVSGIAGLAIDEKNNRLFVSDARNRRVEIFSTGDFRHISTIDAGFLSPAQLAIDADNNRLLVADTGAERVEIFDLASLAHLGAIDGFGTKPGGLAAAGGEILIGDYDPQSGQEIVRIFDAAH